MFRPIKRLIKTIAVIAIYRIFNIVNSINKGQISQIILMNQYQQLAEINKLPKFSDTGFHVYSQTDEDGFLLFIFSLIGSTNKKVLEICAGYGIECNAANLIINHGWQGLLFDGDPDNIKIGKTVYSSLKATNNKPPILVNAWITAENINELITQNGFKDEIDLLSLDIDGVDYWILKSINCVKPRVIILEYNTYWGAEESVTVPYDKEFKARIINKAYYCGASLRAFVNLGKDLGYRLVGANTQQYNAFFIRNDIGTDIFPEVSVESCLTLHTDSTDSNSPNQHNFPLISTLPWIRV
ncbi:hypothetical protein PN451_07740 [Dolichospermum planctonicum CS-1226]|uniref:Methyltransferase FkbM domain-containing protein n=1 Tax=Dolichospermum planctonicum CS-1226 TaxID=3021751 RepID=A0ABT5AH38_9CYAN|nr:hypothetical protein [Dolichospermum planctonicum]MDB9535730.1 hypothetical protein [Dolichospermum planctonicum CS-1226]